MPVIRKIKLGKKKTVKGEEGTNQGDKNEAEMNLCDPHQQWGVCLWGHTRNEEGGISTAELPIVPPWKPQIVQMHP